MATVYEIPLSPANQTFSVTLGNVEYRLAVTYRDAAEAGWLLDIADAENALIVAGIPLVTGADLLSPYGHLSIGGGGKLYVSTDGDEYAVPTFADLGTLSHLYWVPNE
jgi:hypothetical protein